VPSKQQLGASLGIDVGSAAATIMEAGEAQHIVDEVISSISTVKSKKE
jgi:large subunit ribosomal protein L7Ae